MSLMYSCVLKCFKRRQICDNRSDVVGFRSVYIAKRFHNRNREMYMEYKTKIANRLGGGDKTLCILFTLASCPVRGNSVSEQLMVDRLAVIE